ncbi:Ribonuclease P protein subunit p30 [Geranomyces michiganensis]|nr:Ribonuclease P protein subunit p30 [Geranomyces michiganensis]
MPFVDLNVPYPSHGGDAGELKKTVKLLHEFGYSAVAYTITANCKDANKPNPIKPLKQSELGIPTTHSAKPGGSKSSLLSASPFPLDHFEQLTRLTIVVDDVAANYKINSTNPAHMSYDLLAVQPTNEKVFQLACSSYEVDIISLDMGSRLPFFLKPPSVNMAVSRGVFFEISYGAAIRDQTARKHLVSNAAVLVRLTGGKNVIFTSGAEKAMEVRGPYDVINLYVRGRYNVTTAWMKLTVVGSLLLSGYIFSMNQDRAKHALDANCRAVRMHAATRRQTHLGIVSMEPSGSLPAASRWKADPES